MVEFHRNQYLSINHKNGKGVRVFKKIVSYLIPYGVKKVSVFGSYARGEMHSKSDVDIIVRFKKKKSFLDLVKIEQELSEKLDRKVDLLTEKSISPYLIDAIRKESVVIYG